MLLINSERHEVEKREVLSCHCKGFKTRASESFLYSYAELIYKCVCVRVNAAETAAATLFIVGVCVCLLSIVLRLFNILVALASWAFHAPALFVVGLTLDRGLKRDSAAAPQGSWQSNTINSLRLNLSSRAARPAPKRCGRGKCVNKVENFAARKSRQCFFVQ